MTRSDIEPVSGELVDALLSFVAREGALDGTMLEGAWVVALAAGPDGAELRDNVLEYSNSAPDSRLLRRILGDVSSLPPDLQREQGDRLLTLMTAEPSAAAQLLASFDETPCENVSASLRAPLSARAKALASAQREDESPEDYERRNSEAITLFNCVDEMFTVLVEHDTKSQAELFFRATLGSGPIRRRDSIDEHLHGLTPVLREDLTADCVSMAGNATGSKAAAWLAALDPARAWSVKDGQGLLAAARAFAERVVAEQVDEADIAAFGHELARLRSEHDWPGTMMLEEMIASPEDLSYDQFEEKLRLVKPLLDVELVAPEQVADTRAVAATGELNREHAIEFAQDDPARFVAETFRDVLPMLETPTFETADEALGAATWLPQLDRARLLLLFDVAAKDRDLLARAPLSAETVCSYIEEHADALDFEIAAWVAHDPGDTAIHELISRYASRRPEPLLDALHALTATATAERRLTLAEPFLGSAPGRLLDALSFHDADQDAAVKILLERYRSASNNQGREQVLLLWRALRPTEPGPRRVLIEEVMIPMATLNREALDLVLREINLAIDPPKTKTRLRKALREGGQRFKREKQVRAKLEELGWSKSSGRFVRRDEDID